MVPYTIILPTEYGMMMVNRFDINQTNALLKTNRATDAGKVQFAQRVCFDSDDGSVALDIGANFGTYTLAMANVLKSKNGKVYSFEAQRIIYNMICGSVALNSLENVYPIFSCVGDNNDDIEIPNFDYSSHLNFGSIEFGGKDQQERLNQERQPSVETVRQIRIDDLGLEKVAYVKIDVEGMEVQVLRGALNTISSSEPVLQIEILKTDKKQVREMLEPLGYTLHEHTGDFICIPKKLTEKYKISAA